MKIVLVAFLLVFSFLALAEQKVYTGNDQGAPCTLHLDLENEFASLDTCGVHARDGLRREGNTLVIEGGAEFTDCKIKITLNRAQEPVQATLSTKHLLRPFYMKKSECKELRRVR